MSPHPAFSPLRRKRFEPVTDSIQTDPIIGWTWLFNPFLIQICFCPLFQSQRKDRVMKTNRISRRSFLAAVGLGATALALDRTKIEACAARGYRSRWWNSIRSPVDTQRHSNGTGAGIVSRCRCTAPPCKPMTAPADCSRNWVCSTNWSWSPCSIQNRTPIDELYLAGAWGNPGGGDTAVPASGRTTFEVMMKDGGHQG